MSERLEQLPFPPEHLTIEQDGALRGICERYSVSYDPAHYINRPMDALPEGYVSGWVGGSDIQEQHRTIYIGCAPDGRISS
jgi:hypothetical protein